MKLFETLNEDNFLLYASHHYQNSQCTDVDEFYDDLNRFKYLKRLLKRYQESGDLQERLILNHLVVIYNVFGISASNKMVYYKIQKEYWPTLKPFLVYLDYLPENEMVEVPLDEKVVEKLRKL